MLRYNIKTGVSKIKTKTAIVISAVTLGISGLGMAVAIPALSHAAPSDCGSAHGAPGGFGPGSPWGFIVPAPQGGVGGHTFGQAQGVETGQYNSGLSVICNQ
jgi:hypothetical protein